jgi:hypothetical protein
MVLRRNSKWVSALVKVVTVLVVVSGSFLLLSCSSYFAMTVVLPVVLLVVQTKVLHCSLTFLRQGPPTYCHIPPFKLQYADTKASIPKGLLAFVFVRGNYRFILGYFFWHMG